MQKPYKLLSSFYIHPKKCYFQVQALKRTCVPSLDTTSAFTFFLPISCVLLTGRDTRFCIFLHFLKGWANPWQLMGAATPPPPRYDMICLYMLGSEEEEKLHGRVTQPHINLRNQ